MKWLGKIILGNWKMHGSLEFIAEYFLVLERDIRTKTSNTIGLAVPFPYLSVVREKLRDSDWWLGVQDVSQFPQFGAYTGEVNVSMLTDFNTRFALVGHSERRQYFSEKQALLSQKIENLLAHEVTPVYCIGESLAEKEQGLTEKVLQTQLQGLVDCNVNEVVIAYEPVWAIGTGKVAKQHEIESSLQSIRTAILSIHPEADKIPLLYGGSVNLDNASLILSMQYVDGLLIGGASLKPLDFIKIAQSV